MTLNTLTGRDRQVFSQERLESILNDVTMENTALDFHWQFEVKENNCPDNRGWFVSVTFERPDTDTKEIGVGRGRPEFVASGAWESGVVKTCWLLIELVIRHELMEAFRWQGKRIFNPHNSVYELAKIQ